MISIRREMEQSDSWRNRFQGMLQAFLRLSSAVPAVALPADQALFESSKLAVAKAIAPLSEQPGLKAIDSAAQEVVEQLEQACQSNQSALEERDAAVRDVVEIVAEAVSSFKGTGTLNETKLSRVAEEFEALTKVENLTELRIRLRIEIRQLRGAVEQMRSENETSLERFGAQVATVQRRMEMARKDSDVDRLTGLGSRRVAERNLQALLGCPQTISLLLFDIEGFGEINRKHGALFGDQLLVGCGNVLRAHFSGSAKVFRWGADEFLAISEQTQRDGEELCRGIRQAFSSGKYVTVCEGSKVTLRAEVAFGVAQHVGGESIDQWYRRARQALERKLEVLR